MPFFNFISSLSKKNKTHNMLFPWHMASIISQLNKWYIALALLLLPYVFLEVLRGKGRAHEQQTQHKQTQRPKQSHWVSSRFIALQAHFGLLSELNYYAMLNLLLHCVFYPVFLPWSLTRLVPLPEPDSVFSVFLLKRSFSFPFLPSACL